MRSLGQLVNSDDDGATPLPSIYEIETLLDAAMHDPNNGRAAAAYTAIQSLHAQADRYERDLIRYLRWADRKKDEKPVRTLQQVADLVGVFASRQAVWARWKLVKAKDRGTARRGRPPYSSE